MVDKGHFEEGWDIMVVVLMDCYTFSFIILLYNLNIVKLNLLYIYNKKLNKIL